jgi:hypothetical protein
VQREISCIKGHASKVDSLCATISWRVKPSWYLSFLCTHHALWHAALFTPCFTSERERYNRPGL